MDDYRRTLTKAGKILIVVGAIDVAFWVVCILTSQAYGSTVSVFAIAAGIYLKRGNLHTALWATRFGAAILAASILVLIFVFPAIQPLPLWLLELKLRPWTTLPMVVSPVLILPPLAWAYLLLRRQEVRQALKEHGLAARPPLLWFGGGIAMAVLIAMGIQFLFHGDAAKTAITAAQLQNGDQYQYVVRQMFVGNSHGRAVVTAYKNDEIKEISVKW
jgi:hypothetical protein